MDQSIGGGGTDAALEWLGRSLIRSLNSMPKPSDDLSDEQLHQGLTSGDFEGRDALVAEEILRRRHEERTRAGGYRFGLIGAMVAALWLWIKVRIRPRRKPLG